MQKEIIIKVSPKEASSTESIKQIVASQLDIQISEIKAVRIVKRSIDARQRNVFAVSYTHLTLPTITAV